MYLPEHDSRHWPATQNFSFLGAVFTGAAPLTPPKPLVSDMAIPSFLGKLRRWHRSYRAAIRVICAICGYLPS
jgi:hypothetical protein